MIERRNTLITGANRGLGFEFVRQCLHRGDRVFAGCRQAAELQSLAERLGHPETLHPIPLDVSEAVSIEQAVEALTNEVNRLDVLIHNAGITGERTSLDNFDPDQFDQVLRVNLFAPVLLTQAALDLLVNGSRIAILTSRIGVLRPPVDTIRSGGGIGYAASKAAMHRAIPILAGDLAKRNIFMCGVDPGWVRTDMTRGATPTDRFQLSPETSVRGMLEVIDTLEASTSGHLFRWNGETSCWYAPMETDDELQRRSTTPQ